MTLKLLYVCSILGMFPLHWCGKKVITSLFGLITNVFSALILVSLMCSIASTKIKNQLAFTSVQFTLQILNSSLLLIILVRRNVFSTAEADVLSKLFFPWSKNLSEVRFVFLFGFCIVFGELAFFANFHLLRKDYFFLYDFTLLLRVAFEFQIIVILMFEEKHYENLNNSFRTTPINDASSVYVYRVKYEHLHELRSLTNKLYSFDMLLYFLSSLLCMLLVCFDVTELFSSYNDVNTTNAIRFECLRFIRLLIYMSYVVWMWDRVTKKCTDTMKYNFQHEIEKLPLGVANQMIMFLDDVLLRNKLFCVNKYFNIDMSLLYNITGTIFAYFTLIITSLISQQRTFQ